MEDNKTALDFWNEISSEETLESGSKADVVEREDFLKAMEAYRGYVEDNKTKEEILRRHIAEFEGEDCTDKVWDEMIAEDGIAMPILKAMEVHTQQSTKLLLEEKKLDHEEVIKQRDAITELSKKLFTADQSTKHLQDQLKDSALLYQNQVQTIVQLQDELDSWKKEHFEMVENAANTIKELQDRVKELEEGIKRVMNQEIIGEGYYHVKQIDNICNSLLNTKS